MSAPPKIAPVPAGAPRPRVSIVTATYNARDALAETLDSVASQDFPEIEHVVVDGGSTDGSVALLQGREGPRWISEPDGGIADAMNKGVGLARGEMILALHAGDVFDAGDSLSAALRHATPGIDILVCGIRFGRDGAARIILQPTPHRRLLFKPIAHQGTLCARAVFERVGGFDEGYRVCMDYDFFLRARSSGARFAHAPVVLARMDDGGLSSRRDWPALRRRFAEERRAQLSNSPGAGMRAVYALYWPAYLAYRRARALMSGA